MIDVLDISYIMVILVEMVVNNLRDRSKRKNFLILNFQKMTVHQSMEEEFKTYRLDIKDLI